MDELKKHVIHVTTKIDSQKQRSSVVLKSYSFEDKIDIAEIPFMNAPGSPNPALETGLKYLQEKGFNIIGWGVGLNNRNTTNFFIMSDTWKSIK